MTESLFLGRQTYVKGVLTLVDPASSGFLKKSESRHANLRGWTNFEVALLSLLHK